MKDAGGLLKSDSEAFVASKQPAMVVGSSELEIKGKRIIVPSVQIDERTVIATGRWLKIAAVRREELVEGPTTADPESFILALKNSGLKANLLTPT
jgi:hypothetical protein